MVRALVENKSVAAMLRYPDLLPTGSRREVRSLPFPRRFPPPLAPGQSIWRHCRAAAGLHLAPLAGRDRNLRVLRANPDEEAVPRVRAGGRGPLTPTLSPQAVASGAREKRPPVYCDCPALAGEERL